MRFNRTTKLLLTLPLVAAAVWLATRAWFYNEALISAFFGFTLLSVIIIHLRIRPSWNDAMFILLGMFLAALFDFGVLHFKSAIMAWPSFAGLSSLLIFGLRTVWSKESERKVLLLGFVPAVLFVASEYFADTFLRWSSVLHPKVFDLYLFSFDSSLGVQIPFLLGQAFSMWPDFRVAGMLFYIGLPIPIALIYAGRVIRFGEKALPSFVAFLATGPLGVFFYNLLPALGPRHLFGTGFPWHALTVAQAARLFVEPVALAGPPNAIPSLHLAWMLLVWWYSRELSLWERLVAFIFLAFTVLSTMGSGEHYFIDLVVAFPYSLMMMGLCASALRLADRRRLTALGAGLLITLGWLLLLRYALHLFWRTPLVPWALCAGTVALSVFYEKQLHRAACMQAETEPIESPALEPVS